MAHVLVIEDNPANMELMTYLLEAFGHSTVAAFDGEAGIQAMLGQSFDLVVCDVYLPGIDGFALAEHVRTHAALKDLRLVAVTALAMPGDRERLLDVGFDGYLSKPIDPEIFVGQLESFLAAPVRGG